MFSVAIADPEETSIAAGIALQAYFEGREISKKDMDKCLQYWRDNVSEYSDPVGRKRDVCCEPFCIPFVHCIHLHKYFCHIKRLPPYQPDDPRFTDELADVYYNYHQLREKQIDRYQHFTGPVQSSTVCRSLGCRRFCGRRGFLFCTEGTCLDRNPNNTCCSKKSGDPAPPFTTRDIDDENDASVILMKVLGPPPANVRYRRWMWNEEKKAMGMVVIGPGLEVKSQIAADDERPDTSPLEMEKDT